MSYAVRMNDIDLNLLGALDALLAEESVVGAARRLGLSSSAMSRTLTRLRSATGDPLLVRAGRRLVPTPRAFELRNQVHALARDVRTVLSPHVSDLDIATLDRTFTIRANEGFVELYSAPLVAWIADAAPRARIRFTPKPAKDVGPLRDGQIDLEIGVLGTSAPEVRMQLLFRDNFVGAVRVGHLLLAAPVTPERYAACKHVVASRRGVFTGPIDDALGMLGLKREVVAVVPGFSDALHIASQSDLVALVPRSCFSGANADTSQTAVGIVSFQLPVSTPEIAISAMWHPRMDADPGHRWLRETVFTICGSVGNGTNK
jgi:DNA-binding transcriptional LysR family regulator